MNWSDEQTPVDISGTNFPKVEAGKESQPQRFWYVKDEFIRHSHRLLNEGSMFSMISAQRVGGRWVARGKSASLEEMASFVWSLRLFYMKSECMSIVSICDYLENNISHPQVKMFFKYMRESWVGYLNQDVHLTSEAYNGPIKTNKALIDTLLYSGNFHSQEKYKKRYDELTKYMDERLIFMATYNVLHSGFHMNQITRSLKNLSESNLVILLPNHLRHEWDENCPYEVIR